MIRFLPILHWLEPQLERYTKVQDCYQTCIDRCPHEVSCLTAIQTERDSLKRMRTAINGKCGLKFLEEDAVGIAELTDVVNSMRGPAAAKWNRYLNALLDDFSFRLSDEDYGPTMDLTMSLIARSMVIVHHTRGSFKVSSMMPSTHGYGGRSVDQTDYFLNFDPRKALKTETEHIEAVGISEIEIKDDADYWNLIAFVCADYPYLRKLVICIKK